MAAAQEGYPANDGVLASTEREPASPVGRDSPLPSPALARIPAIGEVLDGKYAVEKLLAQGGMGVVLAARHVQLGQLVAIKMMRSEAPTAAAVERFQREGRSAAALTSEHVARVLDVGTIDGGAPYIVMEYLVGADAASLLRRDGPMPVATAATIVLHACVGVAEAHARGIVHRDLKPANLFITRPTDGSFLVKVCDFGISKAARAPDAEGGSLTLDGIPMGSPMYMSPEQVRSAKDADGRSDVWSLGVILYELLTGQPPFTGEALADVYAQILGAQPVPLRRRRPDVPPEIEQVVAKCLSRSVHERFNDVGELATALAPWANERASLAERARHTLRAAPLRGDPPLPAAVHATGAPVQHARSGPRRVRRHVWRNVLLSACSASVVVGAAMAALSARAPAPQRSQPAADVPRPMPAPSEVALAVLAPPGTVGAPAPAVVTAVDDARPSAAASSPAAAEELPLAPRRRSEVVPPHGTARSSVLADAAPAPDFNPSASRASHDADIF